MVSKQLCKTLLVILSRDLYSFQLGYFLTERYICFSLFSFFFLIFLFLLNKDGREDVCSYVHK